MRRIGKALLVLAGLGAAVPVAVTIGFALQARSAHPDLQPWHTRHLDGEYRAGRADVRSFADYLALEDRLFKELRATILDDPSSADPYELGRYRAGSIPARLALDTRHNRSYELAPASPRGAALLVHGLSDSPYSMRALAEAFYAQGYHVVVLRMPGHGTIPSALRDVRWQDWYGAVVLAARRAASLAGHGRPFVAGGHSTGAALVTLYSLRSLQDRSLPRPERLYLVSPAIGISDLAFLTHLISKLSWVPGLEKSDWVDVLPEYDPYKYNSFPVNAGNQIYRVTRQLQAALDAESAAGRLGDLPRITVFQSMVDSTVHTDDVVRGLLGRLPAGGHALVVFDVNRVEALQGLIAAFPRESLEKLRGAVGLPFRVTLIGNKDPSTLDVAAYVREAGSRDVTVRDLATSWPPGVLSLGHVAMPFPPDDPVYGLAPPADAQPRFALGAFPARGESGALVVPLGMLARLRCNPFFDVIRAEVAADAASAGSGGGLE